MKTLIVEDDRTSRLLLQQLLRSFGESQVAINGKEALVAISTALRANDHYDLICLDIMMPEMDGHQTLKELRAIEESHGLVAGQGTKVVMTSALRDKDNIIQAFRAQCDGYLPKPINKAGLVECLRQLKLIGDVTS
jgi:two-component system, chemotaxis family, chemotaxis protein CheY